MDALYGLLANYADFWVRMKNAPVSSRTERPQVPDYPPRPARQVCNRQLHPKY
jgi:hypothetical protein